MNAARAFFKKYNAVPATDGGVRWDQSSEEALLGWYAKVAAIDCGWNSDAGRDATKDEMAFNRPLYEAITNEIARRVKGPDVSPAIFAAFCRVKMHDSNE